jgi:hypothetical protein
MVNMHVMTEVIKSVVHVLAGINFEILTLAVSDVELVSASDVLVLAEEGRKEGSVGLTVEVLEDGLVEETNTDEGKCLPAESHAAEAADAADSLKAQPETCSPGEASVADVRLVEAVELLAVLDSDVV